MSRTFLFFILCREAVGCAGSQPSFEPGTGWLRGGRGGHTCDRQSLGYLLCEQRDWLADFDVASWGAKLKGEGREWKRHFRYLPS